MEDLASKLATLASKAPTNTADSFSERQERLADVYDNFARHIILDQASKGYPRVAFDETLLRELQIEPSEFGIYLRDVQGYDTEDPLHFGRSNGIELIAANWEKTEDVKDELVLQAYRQATARINEHFSMLAASFFKLWALPQIEKSAEAGFMSARVYLSHEFVEAVFGRSKPGQGNDFLYPGDGSIHPYQAMHRFAEQVRKVAKWHNLRDADLLLKRNDTKYFTFSWEHGKVAS